MKRPNAEVGPRNTEVDPAGRGPSNGSTKTSEPAQTKISAARRSAFEILAQLSTGRGHSDDLLHQRLTEAMSIEDRHLATALVMGVLRWQIALDAQVRGMLRHPEQKLAEPVQLALRIGAFQLLHLDRIPAHAALSESVELCRAYGQPHATGMVNAILRKIASAGPAKSRVFESTSAMSERLGHPAWLVERWVTQYGRDAALKMCTADQMEPPRSSLFNDPVNLNEASLPIMDAGSRLIAEIAAAALPRVSGRTPRIWDCCAAPGGKTLILALRSEGADLLATDISPRRTRDAERRVKTFVYGQQVRWAIADALALTQSEGFFDLILCDVPCSGTGTLARNPEIRHRLSPADLARQAERQKVILGAALARLAPGGRLLYSTCSLEPEENEHVVDHFLGAGYELLAINDILARLDNIGDIEQVRTAIRGRSLRTLPGVHPSDGFFAALLEKA